MSTTTRAPYTQEISRATPACFLFVLDQSGSMEDPLGGTDPPKRKCDALVEAINGWLHNMIIKASLGETVRDWMHVAVVGYRTDEQGTPIIRSAFQSPLADEPFVPISKIYQNPLRLMDRMQKAFDQETGETMELPVQVPVWVEPVFQGGTPMCHTLHHCYQMLEQWIAAHQSSFPPILIHITDGESWDGNPIPYAEPIGSLATDNGNVLLFNCHLSMESADSILFASNGELLPDELSRDLFKMSSILPGPIFDRAKMEGFALQPNARGFVFNADIVALLQFLDLGTRIAKNLR
jgi:hypothetical protein